MVGIMVCYGPGGTPGARPAPLSLASWTGIGPSRGDHDEVELSEVKRSYALQGPPSQARLSQAKPSQAKLSQPELSQAKRS